MKKEYFEERMGILKGAMDEQNEKVKDYIKCTIDDMEKRLRLLLTAAVFLLFLCTILIIGSLINSTRTYSQIKEMKEKISQIETELASVDKSESEGEYEEFVKAVFYEQGTYYIDSKNNMFYSDRDCQKSIGTDVRFASIRVLFGYDSVGNTVNCYLKDDGTICFSPSNVSVDLERE